MSYYTLIEGDLLKSDAKYICHQTNCFTSTGSNLAKAMFEKFPHSDIYAPRANYEREELPLPGENPGDIVIKGNGVDERYVINMMSQMFSGGVRYPDGAKDGFIARQRYFKDCLLKIMKIPALTSIAFPYKIGCGVAGGSWETYEQLIDIFSRVMKSKGDKTFIYKLSEAI